MLKELEEAQQRHIEAQAQLLEESGLVKLPPVKTHHLKFRQSKRPGMKPSSELDREGARHMDDGEESIDGELSPEIHVDSKESIRQQLSDIFGDWAC